MQDGTMDNGATMALPTTLIVGKKSPIYDLAKWIVSARSSDETRYFMMVLSVTEKRIACTDGRRIHFAEIRDGYQFLAPGGYTVTEGKDIVLTLNKDAGTYPNIDKVIPTKLEGYKKNDSPMIFPAMDTKKRLDNLGRYYGVWVRDHKAFFNLEYFMALSDCEWELYTHKDNPTERAHEWVDTEDKDNPRPYLRHCVIMPMCQD